MSFIASINRSDVIARIEIRKLTEAGVRRLTDSIEEKGFLERYPIAVSSNGEGRYKLLDGNHRLEAAARLGLEAIPAQIFDDLTPEEEYRLAFESNEGLNVIVPQDWTDHAEFIWRLASAGKTQAEMAGILGWSRGQVSQYQMLSKICADAWQIVAATTKSAFVAEDSSGVVADGATTVAKTFTEGLLRHVVNLTAEQQLSLIKDLAAGRMDKAKFKKRAERYRARNELLAEAERQLKDLPAAYLDRAAAEIEKGAYDREWLANKGPGDGFYKLIQALKDERAQKQNYRLICADVAELNDEIEPESVDVIVTDPPYSQEYLPLYESLAILARRALKPGGSLLVMAGQSYVPDVLNLMTPHLAYHWLVAYLTPGGQSAQLWQRSVNTFWKPVLWFVKGEYQGRWAGDVVRSAVNDNDKRYHRWGQSESGVAGIVERFTQPGDTILDPFAGGGTTGVVALAMGRRFIGVDVDENALSVVATRLACQEDDVDGFW